MDEVLSGVTGKPVKVLSWQRLANRSQVPDWQGKWPPKILVRLEHGEARAEILEEAQKKGVKTLKPEIPACMRNDFKKFQKEAVKLRERNKKQYLVSIAGPDIFLRERASTTDKWTTIQKL